VGTFVFIDTIPVGTDYVDGTVTGPAEYDEVEDWITGTVTLAAGDAVTFTFAVTIEAGTPHGTPIVNTAWVVDPDQSTSDTVTIYALTYPDWSTSTKEGTPDTVLPGQAITYTITLTNTGSGEGATDGQLYDPIPDGTSWDGFIHSAGAVYYPSLSMSLAQELGLPLWATEADGGGFVLWHGKVGTTEPVTVSFRVLVDTEAALGQEITNIAYVDDTQQEFQLTDVAEVVGTALLTITKSVDEPNPFAGDQVMYTIVMTNGGDIGLDVTMADDLAGGVMQYVTDTVTGGGVYTDGQIQWEGRLALGEDHIITYQAVVPEDLEPLDLITNTATAQYLDQTTSDTALVEVGGAPVISAWKEIRLIGSIYGTEKDAYPTSVIRYRLTVQNSGTGDALVLLRDVIPDDMGNVTLIDPGLEYTDYPEPMVFTETTVVSLTTQSWRYDVTIDEGQATGEILNDFEYSVDGGAWITTDPVTVTVLSPLANSVKSVDKDTAYVGETLLYTITLSTPLLPTQDVTAMVTDTIPEYTTFLAGSEGTSFDGTHLTWTGPVTARTSVEITFTAQVASQVPQYPTEIVNVVTVDDGINPPFDLDPVTTTVQSKVDMAKTVDLDSAYPGSVLEYTIQVTPTGSSWAEVSDPIPANTTYVDGSVSPPAIYEDGRIKFLAVDPETVTFQVTVESPLQTPADIVNTAYITDETDTVSTVQATTEITSPLVVSKNKVWPLVGPPVAGERMLWRISMYNRSDAATTASVTDVLPDGLRWISVTLVTSNTTGSAGFADGVFTWTGEIDPASTGWVQFPVTVTMGLENGTPITNEAQIDDGAGTILTAMSVVNVSSEIDLSTSTKRASDNNPVPGDPITYTITVDNSGNMDADGITVMDVVPADMTYVSGSASDGASWDGTTLTWSDIAVGAGTSKDLTFVATVNEGVAAYTPINNSAWISQSTLPAAETAEWVIVVGELIELDASKTVEPLIPVAGERLTYTIQVANTGNYTVTDTSIIDPIPANTTYVPGSVTGGATYEAAVNSIRLTGATLEPAESLTVTFAVVVDVATTIINTAQVAGGGTVQEVTATAIPAGPLDHIIVSPDAVTLAAGEVVTFTAVGYDEDENVVPDFVPAWDVANPDAGTISATGVFTAGTIGGYYPNAVVATADSISGYADVTVEWANELFLPLVMKDAS
jgi:uncharacterized repeat protein (TIGR01451 family)